MIKLNNKGMTVVELLASFVIVALIITTLYSTMNNFSDKRVEESAKETIYTYKNLLTKEIYDDITRNGLINVQTSAVTDDVHNAMDKFGKIYNNSFYCIKESSGKIAESSASSGRNDPNCVEKEAYLTRVEFTFRDSRKKVLIVAKGENNDLIAYGEENDLHIYNLPDYDNNTLRVGNVKSTLNYPVYDFEMRFEHPLFAQKYGVFIRTIINIDSYDN